MKGKKNTLADALSRMPFPQQEANVEEPPPLYDLDPNIYLATIHGVNEIENKSTSKVMQKSADRHRRRHMQTIHFCSNRGTSKRANR
jgi:hypothetical protein